MTKIALTLVLLVGCSGNSDGLSFTADGDGPPADATELVEASQEKKPDARFRVDAGTPDRIDVPEVSLDLSAEAGLEANHPDGIKDKCGVGGTSCGPSVQCAATVCATSGAQECRVNDGSGPVVYTCVCCDGIYVCDIC